MAADSNIKDAITACTPSQATVIVDKIIEDAGKGAMTGIAAGAWAGLAAGPADLFTSILGGMAGLTAGAGMGIVEGEITPLQPDGACMKNYLVNESENVAPLATPSNSTKSSAPKRTV